MANKNMSDGKNYDKTQILIWCVSNVFWDTMILEEIGHLNRSYRRQLNSQGF